MVPSKALEVLHSRYACGVGDVRLEAKLQDRPVDFIAWAEHYVEQLDPLKKTPHDPDLEEDRPMYRTVGDEVKEAASRMMGLSGKRRGNSAMRLQLAEPRSKFADEDEYGE